MGDCDDSESDINPGATEVCDAADTDEDCDGYVDDFDPSVDASTQDTWYDDDDGDGYGDPADAALSCDELSGRVADDSDCDDSSSASHPGGTEVCDLEDNDCDGTVDNDPTDGDWYATDNDADGFGAVGTMALRCSGSDNDWDCDDRDGYEPRVADAVNGSAAGVGTLDDPYDSIQDAIDVADVCVIVYAGTYNEALDFDGKDLRVKGVDGADLTIVDATGMGAPAVTFANGESAAAELSGVTLSGGEGYHERTSSSSSCGSSETCTEYYDNYCGGGIYIKGADPSVVDVVVSENLLPENSITESGNDTYYVYSFGGGACLRNTSSTFSAVDFYANTAGTGGGVYVDASTVFTMESGMVTGNAADDGGGFFVDGGEVALNNLAIVANTAVGAGGAIAAADGVVDGVFMTLADNSATAGLSLGLSDGAAASFDSSIFSGDDASVALVTVTSGTLAASYCAAYNAAGAEYDGVTDPTGTGGNIAANPKYIGSGDYHLQSSSPCVNTGDPAETDNDGSRADMGAFGGPGGGW
jgi:Putative metal-binding motif